MRRSIMFPSNINTNNNSNTRGQIPSNIIKITSFSFLSTPSSFSFWSENMVIRQRRMSHSSTTQHHSNNPVYTVSSRREYGEGNCAYYPQEFGFVVMLMITVNDDCGEPSFMHAFHRHHHHQSEVGSRYFEINDSGRNILMIERLSHGTTNELTLSTTTAELKVFLVIWGWVFLVITELRRKEKAIEKFRTTVLSFVWMYSRFSSTMYESAEADSTTLPHFVTAYDWRKENQVQDNCVSNPARSSNAPENPIQQHEQYFGHNKPLNFGVETEVSQQFSQGYQEASALYQQEQYSFFQNCNGPHFLVTSKHHNLATLAEEHQNFGNAFDTNAETTEKMQETQEVVQGQFYGANRDQDHAMPLQDYDVMEPVENFVPLPEEHALLELTPTFPCLQPILPSSVEIVSGSNSGNVASSWQIVGIGAAGTKTTGKGVVTRSLLKRIKEPVRTNRLPRNTARHFSQCQLQKTSNAALLAQSCLVEMNQETKSPSLINKFMTRLVWEMLGSVENNTQSNTSDSSRFARSSTNSSEAHGNAQGETSTSTGGYDVNEGSSASSSSSAQGTSVPQQYILGCAGNNGKHNGGEERDVDGSTITLKMLLETPYSPRGKSTRNRELEEYQQILEAEEELQRIIDELRAKDIEKQKYNNNNNNNSDDDNNNAGGTGATQA